MGGGGGREFMWEGTHVYLWLIHVPVWQKPTQYCKADILQLETIFFFFLILTFPGKGVITAREKPGRSLRFEGIFAFFGEIFDQEALLFLYQIP